MDEHFKWGEHVKANFGNGVELGHVVSGPHDNAADEQKFTVLDPAGGSHQMAFTAESVEDAGGYFTRK